MNLAVATLAGPLCFGKGAVHSSPKPARACGGILARRTVQG